MQALTFLTSYFSGTNQTTKERDESSRVSSWLGFNWSIYFAASGILASTILLINGFIANSSLFTWQGVFFLATSVAALYSAKKVQTLRNLQEANDQLQTELGNEKRALAALRIIQVDFEENLHSQKIEHQQTFAKLVDLQLQIEAKHTQSIEDVKGVEIRIQQIEMQAAESISRSAEKFIQERGLLEERLSELENKIIVLEIENKGFKETIDRLESVETKLKEDLLGFKEMEQTLRNVVAERTALIAQNTKRQEQLQILHTENEQIRAQVTLLLKQVEGLNMKGIKT